MDRYSGQVYFIIPNNINSGLLDTTALRKVDELHSSRRMNKLFLKMDEKYGSVERYCLKKDIELERIIDNADLIEAITRYYGEDPKRFVYITKSEDRNSLQNVLSELADWGYYAEATTPFYPDSA